MSHLEQRQFCQRIQTRFPNAFRGGRVLDVGSLDINGNNRALFDASEYVGIDVAAGANVDVICLAHEYPVDGPDFDTIISTEAFEHDRHFAQTLPAIVRLLRRDGLLLFTCATTGRARHGTPRESPRDSPLTAKMPEWGDYYHNVTEADVCDVLDIEATFRDYEFCVERRHHDLQFWGIKR